MSELIDNWSVQLRKGILELAVLTALAGQEHYAYNLVKRLVNIPGLGVTEGTLYPLLSRLRSQGLLESRLDESPEGPVRKYYRLTTKGRNTLNLMETHLESVLRGVKALRSGKEDA